MTEIFQWTSQSFQHQQGFSLNAVTLDDEGCSAIVKAESGSSSLRFETYLLIDEIRRFSTALDRLCRGHQLIATLWSFDEEDELTVALPYKEAGNVLVQIVHGRSACAPPDIPLTRNDINPTVYTRVGWFSIERSFLETWIREIGCFTGLAG